MNGGGGNDDDEYTNENIFDGDDDYTSISKHYTRIYIYIAFVVIVVFRPPD